MKIDQRDADAALGTGEVHAHSSWILPLIFLALAVAIGIGIYIFLAGPTVEEVQGNITGRTYAPTDSTAIADVRIDASLFRIPANYTQTRGVRSGGEFDKVDLHALLPDMKPWSRETAAEFSSSLANTRVVRMTLAITRSELTPEMKFERGIQPAAINPDGEPGPFGLTQFKFGPGTGYENTEWFSATLENGSTLVMRCDNSATPEFGSNCVRVTVLKDKIGLTYIFKRTHLEHWKAIDSNLMTLIEGFRKPAQ